MKKRITLWWCVGLAVLTALSLLLGHSIGSQDGGLAYAKVRTEAPLASTAQADLPSGLDVSAAGARVGEMAFKDTLYAYAAQKQGYEGEGEGEGEGEVFVANLDVADAIDENDQGGLVPLMDWVALFRLNLYYDLDEQNPQPAPRYLTRLEFTIRADDRTPEQLGYANVGGPELSDLLEFGLFTDTFADSATYDGVLDTVYDQQLLTWDPADPGPYGTLTYGGPGNLAYTFDFVGNGTPGNPEFPLPNGPLGETYPGRFYYVAVRTSATWRSQLTLSYEVTNVEQAEQGSGVIYAEEDSYSPSFLEGETLLPGTGYSSSFAVWDISGGGEDVLDAGRFNAWNWPFHYYTPTAEYFRPRWDVSGQFVDMVAGEWLEMRRLFALETWVPAVGINVHSAPSLHFVGLDDTDQTGHEIEYPPKQPQLREVNAVFTDIGGNPNGTPGNGGFEPRDGFDRWTTSGMGEGGGLLAPNVAYNGAWVWHDGGGTAGVFDPPTPNSYESGGGISLNGDTPLGDDFDPFVSGLDGPFIDLWQYEPYPAYGGDPWWKIKMRFVGSDSDRVEAVPDMFCSFPSSSEYSLDYFVVFRADSGYQDASMWPGDGTGLTPGADFRVFIEPRNYNAETGHYDGGIHVDSMIPGVGNTILNLSGGSAWQDDDRWGSDEPWWPQRTTDIRNTKPMKFGLEVHDLVLTYDTNNFEGRVTGIDYRDSWCDANYFGFSESFLGLSEFDSWLDPYGFYVDQFLNGHGATTTHFVSGGVATFTASGEDASIEFSYEIDDILHDLHFPFESVPFYISVLDDPLYGPRSVYYPYPPAAPTLPEYDSWLPFQPEPSTLPPGQYPRLSDWPIADRASRLLKQHTDVQSTPTAMLGINVTAANDPVVNRVNQSYLDRITVAFWGPDFTPEDLMDLDPTSEISGVSLWEDSDGLGGGGPTAGVFFGRPFEDFFGAPIPFDAVVPLVDLEWPSEPERIDLDGDGLPDDMNGDGVVDDLDRAWVLRLALQDAWRVPYEDSDGASETSICLGCEGTIVGASVKSGEVDDSPVGAESPVQHIDLAGLASAKAAAKVLDPPDFSEGDDLFIAVRTSSNMSRFEQFRAVIPATLPDRSSVSEKQAGIRFLPKAYPAADSYVKFNPEEGAVQDYYYHDMLESNVPVRLKDLTSRSQRIQPKSSPTALLGIDASTNLPDNTVLSGTGGEGGEGSFALSPDPGWTEDAFAGHWLVDTTFRSFAIVSNDTYSLALSFGEPANTGASTDQWWIVKNPTFLEQVIVEFYNVQDDDLGDNEIGDFDFKAGEDLLPLDIDQKKSGVALYRDNDADPDNRNGVFDPDIDLPLTLDAAPLFIGEQGEPDTQILFVFSSPGTDNWPEAMADQQNTRQWVPDTFGLSANDPFYGSDFFVVVRTSDSIDEGDDFRVGLVSWGPNTPTEPDPDSFVVLPPPETPTSDLAEFLEFPWGSRALGFITIFRDEDLPCSYYLEPTVLADGTGRKMRARKEQDASGFNWVRSSSSRHLQTNTITAQKASETESEVVISSASESELPAVTQTGGFDFIIRGSGFGSSPEVTLNGIPLTVTTVVSGAIDVTITEGTSLTEPVELTVRNPVTGGEATRDDLFSLGSSDRVQPEISFVSPTTGMQSDFPVRVFGSDFNQLSLIQVLFGDTVMPVLAVSGDGTEIQVDFPSGGMPKTGALDVTVRNYKSAAMGSYEEDVLLSGFAYTNAPERPCFIATAAYGTAFESRLDTFRTFRDNVLLKTAAGTALVDFYYRMSPDAASVVAQRPWLALLVRLVLTPVAWVLDQPSLLFVGLLALLMRRKWWRRAVDLPRP